jgi:hypothetical protein
MSTHDKDEAHMEPLATYSDRIVGAKRQFTLISDAVLVSGSTISGTSFELRVPLDSLQPTRSRIFYRQSAFWAGVMLAGGAGFVLIILTNLPGLVDWRSVPVLGIITLGILGLVLALITGRKLEVARFITTSGVVGLDIIRGGRERDRFQSFVDAVTQQIQSRRAA